MDRNETPRPKARIAKVEGLFAGVVIDFPGFRVTVRENAINLGDAVIEVVSTSPTGLTHPVLSVLNRRVDVSAS